MIIIIICSRTLGLISGSGHVVFNADVTGSLLFQLRCRLQRPSRVKPLATMQEESREMALAAERWAPQRGGRRAVAK